MTTIDVSVGASEDDAAETSAGAVVITGTTLANCDDANEWNGFIFGGITIPAGATIDVAYMTLHWPTSTLDEPDVTIFGLADANPAGFVAGAAGSTNISELARTTASVDYASADLGAPGSFNTASLVTIVQELVNTYGAYSSGRMGFVWRSRANDASRDTTVTAWDHASDPAPALHIEYTAASGVKQLAALGVG